MDITLLYASCRNAIAINGELPVHLPEDLKWFKAYTMDKVVVMGRKTLETLPKPLPGRTVVCLTNDPDYEDERCDFVMNSVESILEWAENLEVGELVIAGGAEIYQEFLFLANKVVRTRINHTKIKKRDFDRALRNNLVLNAPDISLKGEFDSATVVMKTNEMVVIEYVYSDPS